MGIKSSLASSIVAAMFAASSTTALADDLSLVGVWDLISLRAEDAQTGGVSGNIWGERPIGLLTHSAGGHMSAVLMAAERKPLSGEIGKRFEELAQLFTTVTSYAGTYSANGGTVTHHVEAAGDPSWVGKGQIRFASLTNGFLTVSTPPIANPADGKAYKITAVWKRLE